MAACEGLGQGPVERGGRAKSATSHTGTPRPTPGALRREVLRANDPVRPTCSRRAPREMPP